MMSLQIILRGSHISVHHHVMAEASAHDEEMEDLVGAEIFMLRVEDRQFQRVDHTADGIDDAAGEQPCKGRWCECCHDLADCHDAYPAHRNIDHGGEPLRAVDPEGIDDDAHDGDAPYQRQHPVSGLVSENDQAHRSVGSGDQDEDHHVIDLSENFIDMFRDIEGVIDGTCGVEQDHTDDEDTESLYMHGSRDRRGLDQKRRCGDHSGQHGNKVGQRTSGIFYFQFHNHSSNHAG